MSTSLPLITPSKTALTFPQHILEYFLLILEYSLSNWKLPKWCLFLSLEINPFNRLLTSISIICIFQYNGKIDVWLVDKLHAKAQHFIWISVWVSDGKINPYGNNYSGGENNWIIEQWRLPCLCLLIFQNLPMLTTIFDWIKCLFMASEIWLCNGLKIIWLGDLNM